MDKWTHEEGNACTWSEDVPCLAVPWMNLSGSEFPHFWSGETKNSYHWQTASSKVVQGPELHIYLWSHLILTHSNTFRRVIAPAFESQEHGNTKVQRSWVPSSNIAKKKMPTWSPWLSGRWSHHLPAFRKSAPYISPKETQRNLPVSSWALGMKKSVPWEFIMTCP